MKPRAICTEPTDDLFKSRLDSFINTNHELVILANRMDWDYLDKQAQPFFAEMGRPAHPTRLMAGLHCLKYMFNLSDEAVCERWIYDPYFQYFTGETYFQHQLKIARSDMTHWRKRLGEEFCVKLLQESLRIAHDVGALRTKDLKRTVVDTTVQEKAISYPTAAKLTYRAMVHLARLAKRIGMPLRQNYLRVGKFALMKSGRYRHAKQIKRAKRQEKFLNTRLGRVIRDIERQSSKLTLDDKSQASLQMVLGKAKQIHQQQCGDQNYLYAWHAPEVECIGKGKPHKPYEFGVKVSVMTNLKPAPGGHFVLHAKALPGRPYDGHTLVPVLAEKHQQIGIRCERSYVDRGYRGHDEQETKVYRSGQKRGVTPEIRKELRRRSVIEPIIGHVKNDCRMLRNYLRTSQGDAINVLLASAGFNFRQLLRYFRQLFCAFFNSLLLSIYQQFKINLNPILSF